MERERQRLRKENGKAGCADTRPQTQRRAPPRTGQKSQRQTDGQTPRRGDDTEAREMQIETVAGREAREGVTEPGGSVATVLRGISGQKCSPRQARSLGPVLKFISFLVAFPKG